MFICNISDDYVFWYTSIESKNVLKLKNKIFLKFIKRICLFYTNYCLFFEGKIITFMIIYKNIYRESLRSENLCQLI